MHHHYRIIRFKLYMMITIINIPNDKDEKILYLHFIVPLREG